MTPLVSPLDGPMGHHDANRLAEVFRVLAEPNRLTILSYIAAEGPLYVNQLGSRIDLAQPTISHHMAVLSGAGLLLRDKAGSFVYHRIAYDRFAELAGVLTPVRRR
jgi:ArsR family transcriptional regulator